MDAKDLIAPLNKDSSIKHVYAIMSGKGGVGKAPPPPPWPPPWPSGVIKVGIMDADITGPSIPHRLRPGHPAPWGDGESIFPELTPGGIKIISLNLLLENKGGPGGLAGAACWAAWSNSSGPTCAGGELDYLFIDMPPERAMSPDRLPVHPRGRDRGGHLSPGPGLPSSSPRRSAWPR